MKWENKLQLGNLIRAAHEGGDVGLIRATEHVRGVADELVPIEEGTLVRSGEPSVSHPEVEIERLEDGASRTSIVYNTPYARKQHEDLSLKHEHGQAKYLEQPLTTEAGTARKMIAQGVKEAM